MLTKVIKIASLAIVSTYVSGCAMSELAPDKGGLWLTHDSTPLRGEMGPPMGDNGKSEESTWDGLSVTTGWDFGPLTVETEATYVFRSKNLIVNDDVLFSIRVGKEWDFK